MSKLKCFFKPVNKYRYRYWTFLLLAVIGEVFINYVSSFMNKNIFNSIEYHDHELFVKGCIFGVVLVVTSALHPFIRYFHMRQVRYIIFDLKTSMVKRLIDFRMKYFDSSHSAEAMQKISFDADFLKASYFSGVYSMINNMVLGSFSIVMMVYLNVTLALISIVIAIVTVFLIIYFNKKIKNNYKVINGKLTTLTALFSDILHGIIVIKMCGGSGVIFDRYNQENEEVNRTYNEIGRLDASMEMCNFLVGTISTFGTIWAGVTMAHFGQIDYGTVMAIATFQITLSNVFRRIGGSFSFFMSSLSKYERIEEFMKSETEETGPMEEIPDTKKETELGKNLAVEFNEVAFSYNDAMVIDHLSFQIPCGSKYILAGKSGCGKSTIFKLLLRMYDVNKGCIKIFGNNLEQYNLQKLREQIAYVSQDCYLFEGTIFENIVCKEDGVTEKDVECAGKMAGIDEFIRSLEHGYNTEVRNGGVNLSGGQRQRIVLARALLRKASIILLDEVTSALDSENEYHLYETLNKLSPDVTVIMITHRMDTVRGFDHVVYI
jgi:ATP-binding cassette subfamily B protein